MKIVTDTSPLHYLGLIEAESILPNLFASVMTPPEVVQELAHPRAPAAVRAWASAPPAWLHVASSSAALLDTRDFAARVSASSDTSTGLVARTMS